RRSAAPHCLEGQRASREPAGQGFRAAPGADRMAPGLARTAGTGPRGAHRPAGPLAGRGAGAAAALQPVAAGPCAGHGQRPAALRALHERAGRIAVSRPAAGARQETAVDKRVFGLLSASIALVLAVHATHLPWWLTASAATLLAWRWWQRRRRPGRVP